MIRSAAVLLLLGLPHAAGASFVDYLHVEANEGGSSGGHAALRFGPETFHFQQQRGGLIRLRRDDSAAFDFRYAMLGNRPIHVARIAVSEPTYALLRDAFARRLLVQAAQFEQLDELQDDVTLLELWLRRARSPSASAAVPVRAAGYFLPEAFAAAAAQPESSPALAALRAAVGAARGGAFLAGRIAALRAGLTAWKPRAVRRAAPRLARDVYPSRPRAASVEYAEQLEALTALEVLAAAPSLRPDAYRVADAPPPLDPGERWALATFGRQLTADLAALAQSARPDFGYPLLLGMARLAAIETSLARGRLVVLDAFEGAAPTAPVPEGPQREAYLAALAANLDPALDRSRHQLLAEAQLREADYSALETAANRWLEVDRARRLGAPIRMDRGRLLPARPAERTDLVAPPLSEAAARVELAAARAAAADYRARLAELYGYNLITRNCVSEIFATMDAAFADAGGAPGDAQVAADESRRRLGGVVDTRSAFNFIPAASALAVERTYAVVAHRTRPSYRQLRLAELVRDEPAWRVALRESNTLTSTLYHADPNDSAFLFFTDDRVALRPLLGAANLLVGVADGALGLATWPVDRGARLRAGALGAVFSLPELAFVNIRKGSLAWVEPNLLPGARSSPAPPEQSGGRR